MKIFASVMYGIATTATLGLTIYATVTTRNHQLAIQEDMKQDRANALAKEMREQRQAEALETIAKSQQVQQKLVQVELDAVTPEPEPEPASDDNKDSEAA